MNSAQLVNLIIEKLRRAKFVEIGSTKTSSAVRFIWGFSEFQAVVKSDNYVHVYMLPKEISNTYTERLEGMLNGLVRNDDGELVKP